MMLIYLPKILSLETSKTFIEPNEGTSNNNFPELANSIQGARDLGASG